MAADWRLLLRTHAVARMAERGVALADVRHVLTTGEDIAVYATARPYPARLVLGWVGARPLHVVVADDAITRTRWVITVYEPDPAEWEPDFRRRRSS
jgi:hypothetical protein